MNASPRTGAEVWIFIQHLRCQFGKGHRLLVDVGQVCADYQDHVLRSLSTRRSQLDELWSWIFCKNKNVTPKIAAKHPEPA